MLVPLAVVQIKNSHGKLDEISFTRSCVGICLTDLLCCASSATRWFGFTVRRTVLHQLCSMDQTCCKCFHLLRGHAYSDRHKSYATHS